MKDRVAMIAGIGMHMCPVGTYVTSGGNSASLSFKLLNREPSVLTSPVVDYGRSG